MILLTINGRRVKATVMHIHQPRDPGPQEGCFPEPHQGNPGIFISYDYFLLMFCPRLIPDGGG